MKIEEIIYQGVKENGSVESGGAVHTEGKVIIGDGEGCGVDTCHCSDGYFISIIKPLENGVVRGIKVTFKNKEEFERLFSMGELVGAELDKNTKHENELRHVK